MSGSYLSHAGFHVAARCCLRPQFGLMTTSQLEIIFLLDGWVVKPSVCGSVDLRRLLRGRHLPPMKRGLEILDIVATSCSDLTKCTEEGAAAAARVAGWGGARLLEAAAEGRATRRTMTMEGGDVSRSKCLVDESTALIRPTALAPFSSLCQSVRGPPVGCCRTPS